MKCCSVLFIFKSCSKCLLMMILLYIYYFMQWCTLFYYVTLISLQFLLFLGMVFLFLFLFFQYWRCVFFSISVCITFTQSSGKMIHCNMWWYYSVTAKTIKILTSMVLTTMAFKLELLNQSASLRTIVRYGLCGLCITLDNKNNLNCVR